MTKKILIVEDNRNLRKILAFGIRDYDCKLYLAENVKHAMEVIKEIPYLDMVISDYELGDDYNGIYILTIIQSKYPSALRVLMGGSQVEYIQEENPVLIQEILQKPTIDLDMIIRLMED